MIQVTETEVNPIHSMIDNSMEKEMSMISRYHCSYHHSGISQIQYVLDSCLVSEAIFECPIGIIKCEAYPYQKKKVKHNLRIRMTDLQ